MTKPPLLRDWFDNCGGFSPRHDVDALRHGLQAGLLNEQDEYGMTALSLAVMSGWEAGVAELLRAGADTEARYFRTGDTTLLMAVREGNAAIITALVAGGANPDAPNYWGLTPRAWASQSSASYFDNIAEKRIPLPPPRIQNAEHLADHYHPRFKIPDLSERQSMRIGQAVDLYVYGPKTAGKGDAVKVRITAMSGSGANLRYTATIETPSERTHLPADVSVVEFGPENIASVYVPHPKGQR